ncbi:hypothetical protein [Chryseobacterium sp. 2R14A]|uniref:hypothetical protein n=1 Tax=Chryseobacterium sp. 2R14A TaxID=3380353 RepID=UPI003CF379C2
MRTKIVLLFLLGWAGMVLGQMNITSFEKKKGERLIIPLELEFINYSEFDGKIKFDTDKFLNFKNQIDSNIFIDNSMKSLNDGILTLYVIIDKTVEPNTEAVIELIYTQNGAQRTIPIRIVSAPEYNYTLTNYLTDERLRLEEVTNVEAKTNILTVYGFTKNNKNSIVSRNVALKRREVLAISDFDLSFIPKISFTTIPYKVRPKRDSLRTKAYSGLNNIGLNFDFIGWEMNRYFASGKKANHRLGIGFWAAPSVEEIDYKNVKGLSDKTGTTNQLFLSGGITLSYTYNEISFIAVPLGWDWGMSSISKNWIYSGKRWWGFGLALSPKIFAPILNK